jgi:parallel beta-helix repeat protein
MLKPKAAFFLMLLISATFALSVKTARAEFIDVTIKSDGSINPETSPIILHGAKYLITADFTGSIRIERSNILIDGGGHTLQGIGDVYETETGKTYGVLLTNTESVWVQNLTVRGFNYGILLQSASRCVINGCYTTENGLDGIKLDNSFDNFILKNTITNNADDGVQLFMSGNNSVAGNLIRNNNFETRYTSLKDATPAGIQINGISSKAASENNTLAGNIIEGGITGVILGYHSSSTTVIWNTIEENSQTGIEVNIESTGNVAHHNNFIHNSHQVIAPDGDKTLWDDGQQGNYWSDYKGTDYDENGIGDDAYASTDRYPLLTQVNIKEAQITPPEHHFIAPSPQPQNKPDTSPQTQYNNPSPSPQPQNDSDALSPLDTILGLIAPLFVGVILATIVIRIEARQKTKLDNKN